LQEALGDGNSVHPILEGEADPTCCEESLLCHELPEPLVVLHAGDRQPLIGESEAGCQQL
jgi:hypothetical protein